jgi:hypothetical protein
MKKPLLVMMKTFDGFVAKTALLQGYFTIYSI